MSAIFQRGFRISVFRIQLSISVFSFASSKDFTTVTVLKSENRKPKTKRRTPKTNDATLQKPP
ncbi:MAG: hypothetical protein JWN76_45 [Chitinophagaceae bacterium]|nr:hypothetical protein [Chitinophagaceae bacterium]